jgi:exopolysaccharide biosynthesis polyprenyl glycosylphosphotransferase
LGLILLSPFLLLVALIVRMESKGPVFYSQIRVGLDGKPFPMLKFRSMRVDAEDETGPVWAKADDPRRTRVGGLLRQTSIDELPQLINVLLGDMSIVGPRPERPVFVEQFQKIIPRYSERHKEKAGLTGWAQVNGLRGNTSIIERTKYDLYYIENWSILFDLKIILRTIISQFRGDRNAY